MNHRLKFFARLILFMLLLSLPILACGLLPGGDEEGEPASTGGEVRQADADETQEDAAGVDETSGDTAGGDSGDSANSGSGDASSSGSVESDDGDSGDSDSTDSDPADSEPADSDPADSDSADSDSADSDPADSDPADNDSADSDPADSDPADSDPADSDPADSDPADSDDDSDSAPTDGPSANGWGASGSGPQSACDHPYLPLRTGSSWTYQNGADTLVWEITEVEGDLNNAIANLRITVDDVSIDYAWSCETGTGLASFDFANVNSAATGFEMTLVQLTAEGQYLLPADQLTLGATWDTILESAISFSMEEGGLELEVLGDMNTVQTNTVIGVDPVTFDGQTVDGVLIEQSDDINLVMTIMEQSVEQSMTLVTDTNFGRGIGMVTQTSFSDFGEETSQLVSYFIP